MMKTYASVLAISLNSIIIWMVGTLLWVILGPNVALGQSQDPDLDASNILYSWTIPIVVSIIGTGSAALFAWQRERRIPPTAEQEKIFINFVKEWYSNAFLDAYQNIWKEIEESGNDEKLIDKYWQRLTNKEFPREYFYYEEAVIPVVEYLRKQLHVKKKDEKLFFSLSLIKRISDAEYYSAVRLTLPTIVDSAVMATLNSKPKSLLTQDIVGQDYENLVERSLKKLKLLMIFYAIRENREVCETLIRANLNEKILKLK